jgi:PAS domain S-box-containing protein
MDTTQKLLTDLLEQVPGAICQFKRMPEGSVSIPFASKGINGIYEVSPDEVKEDAAIVIERTHPDDREKFLASIEKSFQTLDMWEIDYRVVLPKKGLRWIRGKAKPEKLSDGSVVWHGYVSDVTKEKEVHLANLQLKVQLQAILDTMLNQIFIKDIEGRIKLANKAAAGYFGLTPDELLGKTDTDLGIDKEFAVKFLESTKQVIESGIPKFVKEGHSVNEQTGEEEWHQAMKVPFDLPGSDNRQVLIVVSDITQRKQTEMELKETISIIGDQNKRLLNFAHIVSHNLRNHAGNISMLLSLYDDEESDDEKEELLSHLATASNGLNETIKDLNEIVATQVPVQKSLKTLNLKDLYKRIKEILTTEIVSHNVKLVENFEDNLTLKYNPAYLESILLNLLSNAIKYRHPDRQPIIDVCAFNKNGHLIFEISDNGLGIDLEKHGDKLFGMYKTFHGNSNSKGIGLFITKNQVEQLGGHIEVESQENKGTTFKLTLT